jgi:hypothetical protein
VVEKEEVKKVKVQIKMKWVCEHRATEYLLVVGMPGWGGIWLSGQNIDPLLQVQ